MSRPESALLSPEPGEPERPFRLLIIGDPDSVHVRRWGSFFAQRGHEIHVAGLWGSSASDAEAPFAVHRMGRPATAFIRLNRLAHHLGVDIVHAHYLTHYGWLARLAGFRPYVVTLWGSDVLLDLGLSRVRRAWAGVVLRGAACITADSQEVMDIARGLGAVPTHVHEIQFGIDTERFAPGPRSDALLATLGLTGRRVIFSPRSVTPLYRTLTLVHALRDLPDDVVLLGTLAGVDPLFAERVASVAAEAGVSERVVFVPAIPHDAIDAFYRAANVVASVPSSDATPVSVLEALATGVPVVATDLPSVRPWLEGVAPDLLVPIDDPVATAAALRKALALTGVERAHVEANGRALAIARADHRSNMLRMEALYRALLPR